MDFWEPPAPRPRPRSSVAQAWQHSFSRGAAQGTAPPPAPPAAEARRCPKAKRDSAPAVTRRHVRYRKGLPKADKATEITPSFEAMLRQRAARRRKKKSEDRGRPRRSTAPSPGYSKQSFSREPRRSKVLNNLYMNLYEEVGEDEPWAVPRVEGLPKACFIFNTIRNGRIHVNDLLLTLHTLGILVTSTEMRKVLKEIDIDANGNLSFTDFLEALEETSPFAQTEAFQNTYHAFSKMRKGLISVSDLQPALISLGVELSFEALQEALKHVYVNKDRQLNTSDFLMAISDREPHYEDVESPALYDTLKPRKPRCEFDFDAKPRDRRRTRLSFDIKYLPKADAPQPHSCLARPQKSPTARKTSSSPRPRFLSFQEKLPTRFDAEDGRWESSKATKRRLTRQEPAWSTIEEDPEDSPEEMASPFGRERIQKSQRFTAAWGPVGVEEPGLAPAGGKRVSDYEALQDAFEIVSKIKADRIEVGDLRSTLQTMGIPLTDQEFQEALQKVTLGKDGTVNFNRFMMALARTRRFSKFSALKDAIAALGKIDGDKVAVSEVLSYVQNLGIRLSDGEFQQALKLVSVDAGGKVYIRDFIDVLSKSPRFSELLVMQDTIQAVSRIRGDLMDVRDLEKTLAKMGIRLSKTEFREMLASVPVDEDGRVKLEQFMTLVSKMRPFSELGALNNAIKAFGLIKEDKVKMSELESCLHHMGVHLSKGELEEVTKSLSVSEDGTVDIKELMSALTGTRRFSNFIAVQEALRAIKHVKEDEVEVSHLATTLSAMGLRLANEVLEQVLKSAHVGEAGRLKFTDFLRTLSRSQRFVTSPALQEAFSILSKLEGNKIGAEDLKSLLSNLDVGLSGEELSDVLQLCPVDDSGKVNLKDFIGGVTSTRRFAESVGLQLTCLAIGKLREDHFDLPDLESTLSSMGLRLAKEMLKEVMKTARADDNGKVNFREFITVLTQLPHFPEVAVLKDAFDAMSNIKDANIRVDVLDSTLARMGIILTEEELRELLASVTVADDGTVNFKDVMMCLTGTRRFTEFEALQGAFNALSKISGDKIEVSNLPLALKALGIHLTPKELQEALTSCPADESGRVNVKKFMTILTNIPRFSEYVALQNALATVSKSKEEKVPVSQLEQTLNSMGVHLTKESLQEGLKMATVDGDGQVNFKDFLTSLGNTQNFSELEDLQNATKVVGGMQGGKIHLDDLKSTLEKLGISLKEEELQGPLKSVAVDERGTVNLKEFLTALASILHFSDSAVLQDAIGVFSRIKEDKVDLQDTDSILASLGISVSSEELQGALQKIAPDEAGKVNFKEVLMNLIDTQRFSETSAMQGALDVISKVEGDKIVVSTLESALANMGITLPEGELEEALKHATVDGDGKVNFKEFLKGLASTKHFSRTLEMEGAVETIGVIKEDTVDVHRLQSIMRNMGIHLTPEEIQKALKNVTCGEDGKVNLKDFMTALSKTRRFSQAEKDRVHVRNLDSILDNMGIYLTNEELREALKHVTVDADGKVYLSKFLQSVRALRRFSHGEGEKVDVRDLDSLLAEMGIHLTPEELQEVLKHATVDGDGKVNVSDFTKSVISTGRGSQAERDRVATSHLDSILGNMGIFLTAEELQEALKHTEVDAEGKVNLSEFMKSVQRLSNAEGEKVDVANLESVLANLGIHLTDEEFQTALGGVAHGADGKVDLKCFMESVMGTRRPSQCERDMVDLQNLDSILDSMGVHLTNEELQEVLKQATLDANGKVNLGEFMKGVKTIQKLPPGEGDKVDVGNLDAVMASMGIRLTPEELQEALTHCPVDKEGTVGLSAFMKSVMDTWRPSQAERDKVDLHNLDSILASMEIHLANEELQEALRHVTVDADGKVNLSEFMEVVRTVQKLPPREGDKVDVGNLDTVMANMGLRLTPEELQEALTHCPVDTDGKVSLSAFTESMMSTRRPSQAQKDNVDVQNLDTIPASMGVHLIGEELQEVLKCVTVDADGKVNMGKFMKEVRNVQKLSLEGGQVRYPGPGDKVDVGNLDAMMASMGIRLTPEELQEALTHCPVDSDGRVGLSSFMKSVLSTQRPSQAERDKVDLQNLDFILDHMGVHLTNEDLHEALKHVTIDADGKVNLGEFMKQVRALQKLLLGEGDRVDPGDLDSILAHMGIYLTNEELQEALKFVTVDADGKVNLSQFMQGVSAAQPMAQGPEKPQEAFGPISEIKMTLKSLPKKMMLKPLPKKTSREISGILLDKNKCKAAKNLTKDQLEAFHQAYSFFSRDADGCIDVQGLETTAEKLGISLTEQEAYDELSYADMDGDGKVNFSDFLTIVSNNKRFIQAVAPEKGSMEDFDSVDATGILFFEVLSKLVEVSALPRKATLEIVGYYRQKFLASTGRRPWMQAGSGAPQGGKATSMSAFAGAARISVMNDKELEAYVETLRASTVPSDSPYAQVPIFPLLPNRDGMTVPKPKKDLQKLEMQRRKAPISSFETHFFHKRNWLREATAFKPPANFRERKPPLSLGPHLMERRHRLTIEDLRGIRLDVKRVTEMYKQGMALKERNRMLRLWRRLHGGQLGLESGSHGFYHTFSTYSWSWNTCQELVTPNELQLYDNKLYHREHSSASSDDSEVKGGIRKGKQRK